MAKEKRPNIRGLITRRFYTFFIIILAVFLYLLFSLYKVVVLKGPKFRSEAMATYVKKRKIEATRGNIYSDDGSLLSTTLPKYRLGMDPSVLTGNAKADEFYKQHIDGLAAALSNFFKDRTAEEYKEKISAARKSGRTYLLLNNRLLDFQEKKKVLSFPLFKEAKNSNKSGVVFDKINVRYAPFGQMAYRTVGYLKDLRDKGRVGIENSFDKELRGEFGEGMFEKMDNNTWRPEPGDEPKLPVAGVDLHSTIDINIQEIVETALLNGMKIFKGNYAVAIVMETSTGKIKALSNIAANPLSPTGYSETYNYALLEARDPGSVFKLPSIMAVLEEKNYPLTKMVNTGDGKFRLYNGVMSDSHPLGTISLEQVIESSSNVGTMKLVQEAFGTTNNEKFYNYLKKYHLIESLDFQLKPSRKPVFPVPAKWDGLQLLWSSVGYSTQYTPLQILAFYNAIANNGYWIQPLIVSKATRGDEVVIDYTASQVRDSKPLCSPETLQKLKIMLEGVVTKGTANNIKGSVYGIAGKTGTAQRTVTGAKGYRKGNYYTTFAGYFPVKNPKYTIIVAVDEPKGSAEGTYARQVTAPVFKEISDRIYLRDMKLQQTLRGYLPDSLNKNKLAHTLHPADQNILFSRLGLPKVEENGQWLNFNLEKKTVNNQAITMTPKTVPNVVGMNLRDALFALENKGLKVRANGFGTVKNQSIPAGSPAAKNRLVYIQLQ
jgi:cell division protein FtsI (penicillin-binding protein 3)